MWRDCYHHGYITVVTGSDMRTEHQVSELLVTASVQRFTDGLSGSSPEDFGQTLFRGHVIYSTFVDDDGGGGITVPGASLGSQLDPDLTGFFLFKEGINAGAAGGDFCSAHKNKPHSRTLLLVFV